MRSETQEKILERADDQGTLRTRHVRSLTEWRRHVQELEQQALITRVGHGQWVLTPRGERKVEELQESEPQQTLTGMA